MSNSNNFKAGVAKVDITPSLGTMIGADFLPHFARFIHDPLHAKTLFFRTETETVVIIVVDICIMGSDFMDDVKAKISHETGIPPENILLSANHNHAAGDIISLLGGAADVAYKNKLPSLIVESVKLAITNLQPAKIAYGSINVPEYVRCRRYFMAADYEAKNPVTHQNDIVKTNPFGGEKQIIGPAAPTDPELCFLAIKSMDDKWISVLGNYSLHYVGDWPDDSITADYFGEFSNQIHAKLDADENFVGIMSQGTSGDVNIWDFMHPERFPTEHYAKTKMIGGDLAQKVFEKMSNLIWEENPEIAINFTEIELNVRKPSAEELVNATASFVENDFNNLSLKPDMIQCIYDREQVLLNEYSDTSTQATQAIKLGNTIIGALPGEFFAETGLKLKANSTNYFSICLANTYGGYVPPAHEIARGGYETWRARSSFLEENAEEKIRLKLSELINKF
jgi:neutral ceramidase